MAENVKDFPAAALSRTEVDKVIAKVRWSGVALACISICASMVSGGAIAGWTAASIIGGLQSSISQLNQRTDANITQLNQKTNELFTDVNIQRDAAASITAAVTSLRTEMNDLKSALEVERQDRINDVRARSFK